MSKYFRHYEGFRSGTLVVLIILALVLSTVKGANVNKKDEQDPRLKAPWVASIFHKNSATGFWEYICGGTITSSSTVITSARCILPRVLGDKFSRRPYHYNYKDLQIVAGLSTNSIEGKDEFTQFGTIGQIRDFFTARDNSDSPYKDLAGIRLKTRFNFSTPYVKNVGVLDKAETILEANTTKPLSTVLIAGFESKSTIGVGVGAGSGVTTRSKSIQSLKVYEIQLTEISTCIDKYINSYPDAFYFDILCGSSLKNVIPCSLQGAGMIVRGQYAKGLSELNYLLGIYSSNSAIAKTEGTLKSKNILPPESCEVGDVIFFTKVAYLDRWGISHEFCGYDLAMCRNNKCRPWDDLCDGTAQCEDSSDETPESCFNQGPCGLNKFRCNYGACIPISKSCNGIKDCVDGSDEEPQGVCKDRNTTSTKVIVAGCQTIPVQDSVDAKCSHPDRKDLFSCSSGNIISVGTTAILKGHEVRSTCTKEGAWSEKVQLKCTKT